MGPAAVRCLRLVALAAVCWLVSAGRAEAQLGALVSPGPLARAHATLEGADKCQQCHERGRKVTAEKCLTCHAPVAKRIAEGRGVHKGVTDCVKCHVDHAGTDGELRPFNTAAFNHAAVTGFALDGKHAPGVVRCEQCHKSRSFLTTSPSCVTCHADIHKGALGPTCTKCHSTAVAFKDASRGFDHGVTAFPLQGAHKRADCAKCHAPSTFKVARFSTCLDCHRTPHPPKMSTACATCHTVENWKTKKFDHSTTAFPLKGEHATVACESCHREPPAKVKPASATCGVCHADTHRGEFKPDCKACHSEMGWARAPFDHAQQTASRFGLADGHGGLTCAACHTGLQATAALPPAKKVVDFRGAKPACTACHVDVHRAEFGSACETCHSPKTFAVATFAHTGPAEFYGGQHTAVVCASCHTRAVTTPGGRGSARGAAPPMPATRAGTPALAARKHTAPLDVAFRATPTTCASCHADPHLGQMGKACETCHSIAAPKFAADRFAHDRTAFGLTGRHKTTACASCHKNQTGAVASGRGTALRFSGLQTTCVSCHADVHLGQVSSTCETCHATDAFRIARYTHSRSLSDLFVGAHKRAACDACHKKVTAVFPAGRGTTVKFKVGTACVSCHEDVHRGALGSDCRACHRPAPLAPSHPAGSAGVRTSRRVGA